MLQNSSTQQAVEQVRIPGPVSAYPRPQYPWEVALWRDESGVPMFESPYERAKQEEALIQELLQAHTTTTAPS